MKLGIISINVSLATKVEIDCNREVDVVARGDGMSAKKMIIRRPERRRENEITGNLGKPKNVSTKM